jgi:O-antigen ligase
MLMINIRTIYLYLFSTLLLLSINLPTVYKEVKIVILMLLMLIVMYKIIKNEIHLTKEIAFLSMISFIGSGLFILNGMVNSNPGAIPSATVFIMWPIVYILLLGVNNSIDIFKTFDKIMLFSSYFISIYGVYFLLGNASVIAEGLFFNIFPEDAYMGIGLSDGVVSVSMINFSSLLFLGPFIFTKFLFSKNFKTTLIYIVALLLLIGIVFLSGRRALLVTQIFSLLLIYFISFYINSKEIKYKIRKRLIHLFIYSSIFSFLVFNIVLYYYEIDFSLFWNNLIEGFSFGSSNDESTQIRTEQFESLIDGWLSSPLFGNGLGAVASVIRDSNQPWAYELTYISLLFQTGIVGVLFYLLLVFYIIWQSIKLMKNKINIEYILPYLIGMISFLIGTASNPYLFKFDYMWVIFLPIMLINTYKIIAINQKNE